MKAGQSTDDAARGVVRSVRMSHRILTCSTSTSARWVLSEICPHGVVTRGSSVTVSACDQDPIVVTWRGLSEPVVPEPVLPVTALTTYMTAHQQKVRLMTSAENPSNPDAGHDPMGNPAATGETNPTVEATMTGSGGNTGFGEHEPSSSDSSSADAAKDEG